MISCKASRTSSSTTPVDGHDLPTPVEPCNTSRSITSTRGIILAGVHDWSGGALGAASPRPLIPVANRPLITYSIDWLLGHGVKEACVCANSDTRALRECLAPRAAVAGRLEYYEDIMPRGPAGCARDAWCGSDCDKLLVVEGTIIPRLDLPALLEAHARSRASMTVAVSRGLERNSADETILSPLGVYVICKSVLDYIPATGYGDIKESLIPQLHGRGKKVVPFMAETASPRVTGTGSYMAVNEWVVDLMCNGTIAVDDYERVGESLVHASANIDPSCKLIGPIMVGPHTRIHSGVTLVGPVSIGSGCLIETRAVICRSAIWDRCRLGAGATMDRCVLTYDARVDPGVAIRNRVVPRCRGVAAGWDDWLSRRTGS